MKAKTKAKSVSVLFGIMTIAIVMLLIFMLIVPRLSVIYKYPTSLDAPGNLPWWSGSCWDESHECKQLDGIVPFTNTIIVDNDWKITNSIGDHYVNDNGDFIFGCTQTINVYYKNEHLGSVVRPDSAGFLVDMTNKIFYDDYNSDFVVNAKDYMRITKGKSKWAPTYYQCFYYRNQISWVHRECVQDSDCDDDNIFTLYDKCENNVCISSEPVECVNNMGCEYFEECESNICVTKYDYKDNDNDGIINKDDACPDVAGSGSDGCCTIIEKIQNYINKLITIIMSMLG